MLRAIAAVICTTSLISCTTLTSNYQKPVDLIFQSKTTEKNQMILVSRDQKLCAEDTLEKQDCPINFYIDDYKSGQFYINNQAKYYLQPATYTLKVKNCTTECSTHAINIDLSNGGQNRSFVISVDENAKPFITQPEIQNELSAEAK